MPREEQQCGGPFEKYPTALFYGGVYSMPTPVAKNRKKIVHTPCTCPKRRVQNARVRTYIYKNAAFAVIL